MKTPVLSIVVPTHNRGKFFRRSLECYALQPFRDFEIIVLDDDSNDEMRELCRSYAPSLGLDLKHVWFKKPPGVGWRDGACQLNYGIRMAAGDVIVTTSPEVMPGRTTLVDMVREFEALTFTTDAWISAKAYMLGEHHQSILDSVDWRALGPSAAVRLLPEFYLSPSAEHSGMEDYLPANIDKTQVFNASIFCGMTRAGWRTIGGYPESDKWGAPDVSFLAERWRRGTPMQSLQNPDSICVHQFHESAGDIKTPRDGCCHDYTITGPWDFIRW